MSWTWFASTKAGQRNDATHGDLYHIIHLNSPTDVVDLVKKIHDDRSEVEHVCHNFEKYRVEFHSNKKDSSLEHF